MSSLLGMNGGVADLTPGLVAHYLLNNNADDSFGINDCTAIGGLDFQGDVASFDGVDDYLFSEATIITSSLLTLSFWVSIPTDGMLHISTNQVLNVYYGVSIYNSGNFLYVREGNGLSDDVDGRREKVGTYNGTLNDGSFKNITLTYRGFDDYNLYVDGIEVVMAYESGNATYVSFTTGILEIGRYNNESVYRKALYSNLRIYDEAKDQAFIEALYAEGYYPKPLPLPTTDGLIAHYPLTGTAEDSTGNYDGTEHDITYGDDIEFGSVLRTKGINDSAFRSPAIVLDSHSVSFSIKPVTVLGSSGAYECFYNDGVISGYMAHADGQFSNTFYINVGSYLKISIPNMDVNTWYNYTIVRTRTSFSVYNGDVLLQTITFTDTLLQTSFFSLGEYINATIEDKDAYFRNLSIYNRALTQQEITDKYNYEKNFRPIDIDDGLVAYYPLAKNSLDNYYNEYDGVDTNITYNGTSGEGNGTTSVIDTNYPHPPNNSSYTFSFWINPNATQSGVDSVLLGQGNISFYYDHSNAIYRGALAIYDSTFSWHSTGGYPIPSGEMSHVVCVVDNTSMQLYVNKLNAGSTTFNGTYRATERNNLNIFANSGGFDIPNAFFNGLISKFRVYNKAITAEQVAIIYNTEKGDFA